MKTYLSKVEGSPEGLIVNIPEELMVAMDWKPDQILAWAELPGGGGFVVSKIEREEKSNDAS